MKRIQSAKFVDNSL